MAGLPIPNWQPHVDSGMVTKPMDRAPFESSRPAYDTLRVFPQEWELQGPTSAWFALQRFARQLTKAEHQRLNVFHWGDSQIEGDRITGTVRTSWQRTWGGCGPGWLLPESPATSFAVRQTIQGEVQRKLGYGPHRNSIHRKLPFLGVNEFVERCSWSVKGNPIGHATNHGWTRTRILGGGQWRGTMDSLQWSGGSDQTDSMWTWNHAPVEQSRLQLQCDSGIVAGIELGCPLGVQIHNIPMRGGSGTLFDDVAQKEWDQFLEWSPPHLILLQFGGNALASMTDERQVSRYAQSIGRNIAHIRTLIPHVPIVFIGPSDMGKDDSTYPMLAPTIVALKHQAYQHGAFYWDLQAVMGGPGSMSAWAERGWASDDGVHLSPSGARRIGQRLDMALRRAMRESLGQTLAP